MKLTTLQEINKSTQKNLKCENCFFCDKKAFENYDQCCTYPGKLQISKAGICESRRSNGNDDK